MADKVLVTGISGFVGGHVALALLDAGYAVRGSVRTPERADKVRAALRRHSASGNVDALEFVALDLLRDDGWREAMAGCRFLQHVASPFVTRMPADKSELVRPAVEGTRRALQAALAADIERIVLTSSFAAIGYGHPADRSEPFTEADWSRTEGADVNAYTESKTRAELEAWSIVEAAGRRDDLVAINPTGILGPLLDDDPGTSGMLVQRLLGGAMPMAPRISFGVVDVRDVAALQLIAMETPGAGGRRFLATAGNLSLIAGARALRAALPGKAGKLPRAEMPDWLVRLVALFSPEVRANIGLLGPGKGLDNRAASALLGRPWINPADAAVAMGRSLVAEGLA